MPKPTRSLLSWEISNANRVEHVELFIPSHHFYGLPTLPSIDASLLLRAWRSPDLYIDMMLSIERCRNRHRYKA